MKLRKAAKKELLDLDDPLETASNDSDCETGDYECLSDIAEEEEEEDCEQNSEGEAVGGDDEEDGDTVHVDASDDDSELAGAPGQDEPEAAGMRSSDHTESGSDAWHEDADQQQQQQDEDEDGQEVAEEEEEDDDDGCGTTGLVRVAFNSFDLLSEDCEASGSGSEGEGEDNRAVSAAAASQASTQDSDAGDGGGDGAGSADGSRPAELRRRGRRRRNPRRRRRCGNAHSSSVAPAAECEVTADAGAEAVAEAAAAQAPERDCVGSPCHSAAPDGEDRPCAESGTDGVAGDTACSDSDGEESVADCWLCFGEGHVARRGARGGTGCGRGCGGGFGNVGCTAAGGDDGGGADSELVAPCRTCAGGLRYIHRSCFESWMKSSWALACPNCRQLYDSAVLDDFKTAASVPSMLLASLPPDHDLQQPLPPFAHVQFCVGGMVELSMACGGVTPVGVLRNMRGFVDDMMRRGGDGGLGLVVNGRPLQLPGFDVTGLVLDLGPSGSGSADAWVDSWPPSLMQDDGYSNDEEDDDAYPEGEGPAYSFRRGAASATDPRDAAYEDSDAEHDSGDGDEPSDRRLDDAAADWDALDWEMLRWPRPPRPPPALREHSFTSGSGSGRDLVRRRADGLVRPAPLLLRDLGPRLDGPSGMDLGGGGGRAVRSNVLRHVLEWWRPPAMAAAPVEEPPLPVPLPPWRNDAERRASAMRSAAERAVLRAEQQRRRADLLLQQRNQQRYAGGSRGQQTMSGTPRGGGGGRRR